MLLFTVFSLAWGRTNAGCSIRAFVRHCLGGRFRLSFCALGPEIAVIYGILPALGPQNAAIYGILLGLGPQRPGGLAAA